MPALYAGDLPCADCAGIRYEIDLRAGDLYVARMTYLGKSPETTFDSIGKWSLSADRAVLSLSGGSEAPELFAVENDATLRKLDREGGEISSTLNYELRRRTPYAAIEPQLRGMYRYMADAGLFEECRSGLKLPVAEEAANVDLQRAYAAARQEPGQPVFAVLQGQIAQRSAPDRDAPMNAWIVGKVIELSPGAACGARGVTHALEGTRWVPVQFGASPVSLQSGQREAFMVLEAKTQRVSGFGGCNRMTGGYQLAGGQLSFSQMAATQMACLQGMDIEQQLLKALQASASWRIVDAHLELFDAAGQLLARFESRNL